LPNQHANTDPANDKAHVAKHLVRWSTPSGASLRQRLPVYLKLLLLCVAEVAQYPRLLLAAWQAGSGRR